MCLNEFRKEEIMNTVVLVGRLTGEPELIKTKENHDRTVINLAVPRSFKNQEGIYETDFFSLYFMERNC